MLRKHKSCMDFSLHKSLPYICAEKHNQQFEGK